MVSIDGNKLVIWQNRIGFGPECCGCCCIDGQTDETKTSREACHDAGGTWYPGIPCSEYPVCSECFQCEELPAGTVVTATIKVWLPGFISGVDCSAEGPFEATMELSGGMFEKSNEVFLDVGDGSYVGLSVTLYCLETGVCEGHSLWGSVAAVIGTKGLAFPTFDNGLSACGTFCGQIFAGFNSFMRRPDNFILDYLYHPSDLESEACRPQNASRYFSVSDFEGIAGCDFAFEFSVEFAYP